ncbi:MAG TPA: amidohydrolase family protein [Gemmatimonadales bacterium]|nr:amidohydrolase family protein [Gemmatimonadales bacterium]
MSSRLLYLLVILVSVSCEASDSTDRETLDFTVHEGSRLGFDLSPDGGTLVFDLLGQLWLLPSSGGMARPLTDAARDTAEDLDPRFLPDGRGVLFQGERGGRFGLWTVSLGGGRPVLVTQQDPELAPSSPPEIGGTPAIAASWARDGHAVAFFSPDSTGATRLWVRPRDAAPRQVAPQLDVTPTRVRWTPDSRFLIYSADGRMWRVADSGGAPTEIPFTATVRISRARRSLPPARFPEPGVETAARGFTGLAIAPDGQTAAMIALGRLWLIQLPGGTARALCDIPNGANSIAWRPDGRELTWSSGSTNEEDLFTTSIENGTTRQVTTLKGRETSPAWSPDGAHLAFVKYTDSARLLVMSGTDAPLDLGTIPDEGTSPPVWSPGSDGLLVSGRARYRKRSAAEFVPLHGGRIRVDRFADAPIFLQWSRDTITFVRHDRLWKAAFDTSGLRSDPVAIGNEPALYLSASRDGTLLFVSEGGLRVRRPDGASVKLGWPVKFTPPVAEPLLIRSVGIVDGTGATPSGPSDVLIEGGRIARIAPAGSMDSTGRTIDGTGRFMIPGLMDLHAHFYRPATLPAFAYFGVTTVRDQGSSMAPLVAYADLVAAGLLPGPRVSYGGFQYYSDWPFDEEQGRGIEPEADTGHVARSIALAAAFGAQHVKTRTFRRWDINARMIEAAHRLGMRATGHCSHEPPLIAAGMDAKEHIGICAPRVNGDMYDDLIQLFKSAGIGVVPTISYLALAVRVNENPRSTYADTGVAPFLPTLENFGWMIDLDAARRREFAREAARSRAMALKLQRAGITVGVGTDVWQVPTAVHMELAELVAAGFTPLEAIHAATGAAAKIIGAETDFGTIGLGMRADLVILDADPTVDIRNTRRIAYVIKDGGIIDREAIRKAATSIR